MATKTCRKCGAVADVPGTSTDACPKCGAIYAKVEAHLEALAAKQAEEEDKAREAEAKAQAIADKKAYIQAQLERSKALKQQLDARREASFRVVCRDCGHNARPISKARGYLSVEIMLWLTGFCTILFGIGLVLLVIALIYSVWRLFSREKVCEKCRGTNIIPEDTPNGQQLLGNGAAQS